MARNVKEIHPMIHPRIGLASRDIHWYAYPVTGIRDALVPSTKATASWPTTAIGHVQIPTGPDEFSTDPYVVKMPVAMDTKAKATANEAKRPVCRSIDCL